MSVLIKGMEMPGSCYKCPLRRRDCMDIVCPVAHERFSVTDVNILEYRLDNCPLVPVPPHGRLIIEADAVETTWMILRGLGYLKEENPKLEQTVREVFATAPAIEVEEHG